MFYPQKEVRDIKLILVRTGKGEGGVVGTAIVDLFSETVAYYEPITELIGAELITLLKVTPNRVEFLEDSIVDFQYLRKHLKIGLAKNAEGYEIKDIQEDYAILFKNNTLDMVYREDNKATVSLDSCILHKMVRELVQTVLSAEGGVHSVR